jgi:N-acetylneuraminic acid mutarotase
LTGRRCARRAIRRNSARRAIRRNSVRRALRRPRISPPPPPPARAQSLGDVLVLDLETHLWNSPRCGGEVAPPLCTHSCTAVGERLFVFGGREVTEDDEGHTYSTTSADVRVLDTATFEWSRMRKRGAVPAARGYHTSTLVGGYLLVLGGWGKAAPEGLQVLSTLDLEGVGSWYTVQVPGQAPPPMYGHSSTLIGGKVVVFGGWDGVSPLASVHVLDTAQL